MKEITCCIHIHSKYSDGHESYSRIAEKAAQAGLDVIILTDHNVWVKGFEGYRTVNGKRVLVLTGEEVHDQDRFPQKNHTLVIGAEDEMAPFAKNPQELMNVIRQKGGMSFLAHPNDLELKIIGETDITWVDWEIDGFTGIELWNGFSELKTSSPSLGKLISNVFSPNQIAVGPAFETIERWDWLLRQGKHISAIGGADAHAIPYKIGPFTKTIFPYEFHFSAIINHLIIPEPLNGEIEHDKQLIYESLKNGSFFIGYDLPAPSRGFSFTITNEEISAGMGETIEIQTGATAFVNLPSPAEIHLLRDGQLIYKSENLDHLSYPFGQPGVYRVECFRNYLGKKRAWIISNPIYVVNGRSSHGSYK